MEQLLELALRNWFVVIIIIAVLSTFRRMRRNGAEAGKQANGMPSFGGEATPSTQASPAASPFGSSSPFSGSPVIRGSFYTQQDGDEDNEPYDDFTQVMRSRATRAMATSGNFSRNPIPSTTLQRSSLKQAVLWAEIIGSPRARRPYKPR
jgi:hypothetical protein